MPNSRTPRILWRVVKLSFTVLIFLVCGILIFRMCSAGDPATMQNLMINEPLIKAYEEHGKDLKLQYQNQSTITQGEQNRGYFSVTQYVFIPEAQQVQLVFRYNNSTIKSLAKDYGLEKIPEKSEELFEVTLVTTTDLTPGNREDNLDPKTLQVTRYTPSAATRDDSSNTLYTYYRYVFDGITVAPDTVGVFADVYYVHDVDYEKAPYGALCLYDDESKWIDADLTAEDIRALEKKTKK